MTDFFADLEAQLVDAHARRPSRRPLAAAVAVLALAGVAVALALSLSSGSSDDQRSARPAPAVAHDAVTILNATAVPGLARRVAERLQREGFTIGQVSDAPAPGAARSVIRFRADARETALAAASRLRVRTIQRLARPEPGPRAGDVVITLGADARTGIVGAPAPAASFRLTGAGGAGGSGFVRREGPLVLSVRADHLGRHLLGAWLTGRARPPRFLGFAPPPRDGRLAFSNVLPADATRYQRLLITREKRPTRPTRPGAIVLAGRLRLP